MMLATVEQIETVIKEVYEGSTLTNALKGVGLSASSFWNRVNTTPALQSAYARAQEARAEIHADEILTIADSDEDPQRVRNRIDARKWHASKMKPSKFGDRIDLNVSGQVDLTAAIAAGRGRVLPMRDLDTTDQTNIVEVPTTYIESKTDSESVSTETEGPSNLEPNSIFD